MECPYCNHLTKHHQPMCIVMVDDGVPCGCTHGKKLIFVTNTVDPNDKESFDDFLKSVYDDPEKARGVYLKWIKGYVIGEPVATKDFVVRQLKKLGVIGLYKLE